MANISTTDLPSPASTYTKTTQTVENYTLKSGRVYKFEAFGAKGGNGGDTGAGASAGGNGSHAVGWYDMRTSATATAQIFAGGVGGTNGAGWGATAVGAQLQGTPGGGGGSYAGGGGGGASGIFIGTIALLVAGGGAGGGGGGQFRYSHENTGVSQIYYVGGGGGGTNGSAGAFNSGGVATQTSHGAAGGNGYSGTANGGGNGGGMAGSIAAGSGGGAGGGFVRGFAGAGGSYSQSSSGGTEGPRAYTTRRGTGGGGSGGTSYIGGVQSLADATGKASTTWAHTSATGNGKVIITEYIMAVNVASPLNGTEYTVSAPSKTSALFSESYTFTVTREIGVGHIGLILNTPNGTLALTSTNGNVFTYTVSNVQGTISSADFSTTSYNVSKPPDGTGYTISPPSSTSVLMGGSYSFTITFANGYTQAFVKLNTTNGKVSYSGIDMNTMTVTVSSVQGVILGSDFTVTVFKV